MFEKEAEERARKLEESQTLGIYDNDEDLARDRGWNDGEVAGYEEGFKDGAEFGFQKGIKAKINTTTISDCPIKDEWHYVKDGDYPKENVPLLCVRGGKIYVAWYYNGIYHDDRCCQVKKPYAWKEITFPKE